MKKKPLSDECSHRELLRPYDHRIGEYSDFWVCKECHDKFKMDHSKKG